MYEWEDTVYPGIFRREANGDFTAETNGYPLGEKLTPASRMVAVPLAGVPGICAAAALQHKQARLGQAGAEPPPIAAPLLAGLTPNGTAPYSPEGPLRGIRSKSAVLVLSHVTAESMQKMDQLSVQMRAFAAHEQDEDLRTALIVLSTVTDSALLARDLAVRLRSHFKSVTLVTDLRGFLASQAMLGHADLPTTQIARPIRFMLFREFEHL